MLAEILAGLDDEEYITMAGSFIPVDAPRGHVLRVIEEEGGRRARLLLRAKEHVQAAMIMAAAQSPTALVYVARVGLREHPAHDDPVRAKILYLLGDNAKLIGSALEDADEPDQDASES
jgi:hypothetical protein